MVETAFKKSMLSDSHLLFRTLGTGAELSEALPALSQMRAVSAGGYCGNWYTFSVVLVFSVCGMSRHLSPSCSPAYSPAGPGSPSVHLALQGQSLAKAQMPLAADLGGHLSMGSSNQTCLGCRAQAAGQEGPEMLQILSFLQ